MADASTALAAGASRTQPLASSRGLLALAACCWLGTGAVAALATAAGPQRAGDGGGGGTACTSLRALQFGSSRLRSWLLARPREANRLQDAALRCARCALLLLKPARLRQPLRSTDSS
jgi:hypothetical protein